MAKREHRIVIVVSEAEKLRVAEYCKLNYLTYGLLFKKLFKEGTGIDLFYGEERSGKNEKKT